MPWYGAVALLGVGLAVITSKQWLQKPRDWLAGKSAEQRRQLIKTAIFVLVMLVILLTVSIPVALRVAKHAKDYFNR